MAQITPFSAHLPIHSVTWRNSDLLDSLTQLHFIYGQLTVLAPASSLTPKSSIFGAQKLDVNLPQREAFLSWWGMPKNSLNCFVKAAVSYLWLTRLGAGQEVALAAARQALINEHDLFLNLSLNFKKPTELAPSADLTSDILSAFEDILFGLQKCLHDLSDLNRIDEFLQQHQPALSKKEFEVISYMCGHIKQNKENKFTNRLLTDELSFSRETTKRLLSELQKKSLLGKNADGGRSISYFLKII